jgi:AcrR family transcriptional regulator
MYVSRQDHSLAEPEQRGPKARTRRLMLDTAIQLMQSGITPSVSGVAEAAAVSRATAYRYFPSQAALVGAVVDEALGPILQRRSDADDAEQGVADLLDSAMPRIEDFEATFRAALKLSLDQWAQAQAGTLGAEPPLQRGHRVALLRDAVAPLQGQLSRAEFDRLVQALALVFGVEVLVVLKDICRLDATNAHRVAVWAARALVRAAVAESATKKAGGTKRGAAKKADERTGATGREAC